MICEIIGKPGEPVLLALECLDPKGPEARLNCSVSSQSARVIVSLMRSMATG